MFHVMVLLMVLSVEGGVGGYSFYWSNGEITEDLNTLSG